MRIIAYNVSESKESVFPFLWKISKRQRRQGRDFDEILKKWEKRSSADGRFTLNRRGNCDIILCMIGKVRELEGKPNLREARQLAA